MKLHLKKKLHSGALQFTVFIAVLIALLLAGLILYAYTFSYFKEQSNAAIENIRLADSALNYILKQEEFPQDTVGLKVLGDDQQLATGSLSQWGVFEKAYVQIKHRQKAFDKIAFIGSRVNADSPTLYLQENNMPLSLVGTTKITGIAYLPAEGVKSGYIAGEGFYDATFINGPVKQSARKLPALNKKTLDHLQMYSQPWDMQSENYIAWIKNRRSSNSFKEKTKKMHAKNLIIIEETEISGNIIIQSDSLIRVRKTALLKDIILIAPTVEVESGSEGNFQIIATKNITIEKNCTLNYPTALVLIRNDNAQSTVTPITQEQVFIDSGTRISGSVCFFQNKDLADFNTHILLSEKSKIKGQVYCEGNFEIKGSVSGSVFTKQFIINMAGSKYINHIYGATIQNEDILHDFGGIIFEKQPKTIVKWLY